MFLNQNASVARLSPNSNDNDKEAYVELSGKGNIAINIQPASDQLVAVSEGVYGKTFTAFTSVSGIEVGDRVTLSGVGKKFIVKGIKDWYYEPIPHLELLLFEGDS